MRLKTIIILSLLLVLLLNIPQASAMETAFSTDEMPAEDAEEFVSARSLKLLEKEPSKKEFACFDVNPEHKIAVAYLHNDEGYVCVYAEGKFLYGYRFNAIKFFAVEWAGDNLNILFATTIMSVTPEGEVIDIATVNKSVENNTLRSYLSIGEKRTVDNTTYSIHRTFLAPAYSKIVATDSDGNETILYDVSGEQIFTTVFWAIFGVAFFAFGMCMVIKGNVQKKRNA